ncbi:hypothetical protein AAMO2058_001451700 [Amorphochlora amoebiformis]
MCCVQDFRNHFSSTCHPCHATVVTQSDQSKFSLKSDHFGMASRAVRTLFFRPSPRLHRWISRRVGVNYVRRGVKEPKSEEKVRGGAAVRDEGTHVSSGVDEGLEKGGGGEGRGNQGEEETTFFRRMRLRFWKHRSVIIGLLLGAGAVTSSVRLCGQTLRYDQDIGVRDERIRILTKELQGRFDVEYESLECIRKERETIIAKIDEFSASWPPTRPLDPRSAQSRISKLREDVDSWFEEKESKLTPKDGDLFVASAEEKRRL